MSVCGRVLTAAALLVAAPTWGESTKFPDWRARLPRPVYDAKPEWIGLYDTAWELAHARIDEIPGLPASRYMDEAHASSLIWIWDTCLMAHFCKYCPDEFPGIESLENFYGVMLAATNAPLPKVKGNVWCGADCGKMLDFRIHHPDNPPLFAWTEYVYALQTGDRARLERVYGEKRWLQRWYELFDAFDPAKPKPYGANSRVALKRAADGYRWGGCPSGMDNTPRGRKGEKDAGPMGLCPENPDLLWVDALAQQGLSALYLSRIATLLGREDEARTWQTRYAAVREKVNRLYWDESDGFYYDILSSNLAKAKVPTLASYWPMLAEMPTDAMGRRLADKLADARWFGGRVPLPSLARHDRDFIATGGYWRGSVWLPTAYMALKALDAYGDFGRARDVATRLVDHMYRTYREFSPHTIWECYSPTEPKPATNKRGEFVRYDFCGWSALGPISVFLEDVIGIKEANAFANALRCEFPREVVGRVGVENYRFGRVTCSVIATTDAVKVISNRPFTLLVDGRAFAVNVGENVFSRVDTLEAGFRHPPHDAKPQTWWHWMNGNVSKEGITADLEAMAQIGLGGAQIFDAGCDIPPGPVAFNTPAWFDAIRHAAKEAKRLGLGLCLPNCSGWANSGGPWNPPENGMKFLALTETKVKGPGRFAGRLPAPPNPHGFYDDIAVFAYPVPPADGWHMTDAGARTTTDGKEVVVAFPAAVTASGFSCRFVHPRLWKGAGRLDVEISDDGSAFRPLVTREIVLSTSGQSDTGRRFFPFAQPVTARAFRFVSDFAESLHVRLDDFAVERRMAVGDLAAKTFRIRAPLTVERAATDSGQVVPKASVIDLTAQMQKDGSFAWDIPAGDWSIVRLGYAANGRCNHPASERGIGLEVDKLSARALDFHFDAYVAKLCDFLGPLAGDVAHGLNSILVDSYEVGSQNWTQGFEREFARRHGYAMAPYYPVFTGHVVGSADETERFLADFRRTVADLFAENYAGALARKCHARGLKLSLEPYGSCPADNLQYGTPADIPMGEFWSKPGVGVSTVGNARFPASLAHVWGRRIVAMEAFTGNPAEGVGRWQKTPYGLKAQGDRVFTEGVNRIIYHRFTHQPWPAGKYLPGMTMGKWGMHFDRTQTWWPLAKDWISYQSRCQFLLQEGSPVAEGLFYCGEGAPNDGGNTDGATGRPATLPYGYNWDICARDALMRLTVDARGRVVAPGGVAYEVLILPASETMGLDVLRKVDALAEAGATVVGAVRPARTPGLAGYPAADGELQALAAKAWARPNVLACTPDEALSRRGVAPDFAWTGKRGRDLGGNDVAYIHRDYGNRGEGYFVAMPNPQETEIEVSFRQTGRVPELWDAERGTVRDAPAWRIADGRTHVRLRFDPSGSVFVMFRRPTAATRSARADLPRAETVRAQNVEGPWTVAFPKGWDAPEKAVFTNLVSWTERPEDGIRYFSGTATYAKRVKAAKPQPGERLILDLGDVKDFAEVRVNGRDFPVLWKPPFRVDVTDAARKGATLDLRIRVTNRWPNRLIGDDRLYAEDCAWKKADFREAIVELPQWVKEGRRSPTGRHTFTTWKHWNRDDKLLPSGLLGPVVLRTTRER